ncbi:MAG TPA: plastocyanin/azurin family copper-binding protein [Roseiflexaceae bacterium]|nr:plastocyanin/azurin family copper-binding protein [Roseiflexaceae bacterium]
MKIVNRLAAALVTAMSVVALTACGGGGGGGNSGGLTIGARGEELAFDKATLTASAAQPVSLTFTNGSSGQNHNWVLVNGGDDVASQVDQAATASGDPNYIPPGDPNVIAHTKLLPGGQNETISFTAPAAGTYTYLCTYPGHYGAGMKGTLTVQ